MSDEDIEKIADKVVEKLGLKTQKALMTMEEAAAYLGLKADPKSLPSIFSRYSSAKLHKKPLKAHYIGRQRSYYREDLDAFVRSRARN